MRAGSLFATLICVLVLAAPASAKLKPDPEPEPVTWKTAWAVVTQAAQIDPARGRDLKVALVELGSVEPEPASPTRSEALRRIVAEARAIIGVAAPQPATTQPTWSPLSSQILSLKLEELILMLPEPRRGPYADRYLELRARDQDAQLGAEARQQLLFALRSEVLFALESGALGERGCVMKPYLPDGFVTIDTQPPSVLYFQGRSLGATPLARHRLPAGCVAIEAVSGELRRRVHIGVESNRVRIYRFPLAE